MKTYLKVIIGVLAVLAVAGAYFYPIAKEKATLGATGDTNSSHRLNSIVFTGSATTTFASFYNNDATDRIITSEDFYYAGVASTSQLVISAATSTSPYGLNSNTNYSANWATLTSSPQYTASTTITSAYRVWPSGTYLNFISNGTTTSGSGQIAVRYIVM
jgi:hypothetical protein